MSFSDHKITAFTHKIADLPDQPNLPADELKARFDSSPEELRVAHNAVCDEGEALAARIDAYRTQTFTGEITREMLEEDVQTELDGKADADDVAAETQSLDARLDTVESALPQKCEAYFGMFTGNGEDSQFIDLGFTPTAVLVLPTSAYFTGPYVIYSAMAQPNQPSQYGGNTVLAIEENGFRAYYHDGGPSTTIALNSAGGRFYVAFK